MIVHSCKCKLCSHKEQMKRAQQTIGIILRLPLQMVASLGPLRELLGGSELGRGGVNHTEAGVTTDKEATTADAFLSSSVQVHPDKLSCSQMLLAAARTFAAQKIKALIADVEVVAGQLG